MIDLFFQIKIILYLNINPSLQIILWKYLYLVMEICNSFLQIPLSRSFSDDEFFNSNL